MLSQGKLGNLGKIGAKSGRIGEFREKSGKSGKVEEFRENRCKVRESRGLRGNNDATMAFC